MGCDNDSKLDLPAAEKLEIISLTPNPFNPSVEISFEIRESGLVTLEIFEVSGRRVITVPLGNFIFGLHRARWDGRDASGRNVGSGVYIVRLYGSVGESQAVKAVLIR
jgi:flagellar hook assembly protein FlgD